MRYCNLRKQLSVISGRKLTLAFIWSRVYGHLINVPIGSCRAAMLLLVNAALVAQTKSEWTFAESNYFLFRMQISTTLMILRCDTFICVFMLNVDLLCENQSNGRNNGVMVTGLGEFGNNCLTDLF